MLRARWVTLRARWVNAKSSLGDAKSSLGDSSRCKTPPCPRTTRSTPTCRRPASRRARRSSTSSSWTRTPSRPARAATRPRTSSATAACPRRTSSSAPPRCDRTRCAARHAGVKCIMQHACCTPRRCSVLASYARCWWLSPMSLRNEHRTTVIQHRFPDSDAGTHAGGGARRWRARGYGRLSWRTRHLALARTRSIVP